METMTSLETELFEKIQEGMDEYNCGWFDQICSATPSDVGVLGSLVKKGLVCSEDDWVWIASCNADGSTDSDTV